LAKAMADLTITVFYGKTRMSLDVLYVKESDVRKALTRAKNKVEPVRFQGASNKRVDFPAGITDFNIKILKRY
jgi:hypothetical protein